ncbi:MAG: M23 family metallopeptidase, partial [Bacteroidetes bacterium]|nr:M23 family metallopeptidase [Bacteroidota bacterium]
MLLTRFIIISILFFNTLNDNPKDKSIFISPVKIPLLLSSNFGELRIDHFHSGLDIKTQGVTGKEVIAAANGYVYRISVSPGGFGKALYVRHPSGYSTVYGHLDKFIPEIEEYVKTLQYEKRSYLVTLFPDKEKFPVRQGELIAWSGNSGSSGGPHLHYEIRKSDSELPVNPLLFEFGTGDNIEPVIERLVIYPINSHTLINNQNSIKKLNVSGGHGNYYIPAENKIVISGLAGFGIKSFDLLNNSYNKCAVYS